MKVYNLARGHLEHEAPSSLTLAAASTGCKRLRPLARKPPNSTSSSSSADDNNSVCPFDLKSFIRPESGARKLSFSDTKRDATQVETHPGGTRWNPTQEQIGILEMLYRGGMRTPNAQQIEQITKELGKYGRIEGKNVFYWFQNHKARERQKQKRSSLGLISHSLPGTTTTTSSSSSASAVKTMFDFDFMGAFGRVGDNSPHKRKSRNWRFQCVVEKSNNPSHTNYEEDEQDVTLVLFPLHPEGK